MNEAKIWKVKGKDRNLTDSELIEAIKSGEIKGDDAVSTRDMKIWVNIKDSVYQFYIMEENR